MITHPALAQLVLQPHRLQQQRINQLLSQQLLAEKAGLSVGTVSRLERGHGKPRLSTIRKLAKALNVDHELLLE